MKIGKINLITLLVCLILAFALIIAGTIFLTSYRAIEPPSLNGAEEAAAVPDSSENRRQDHKSDKKPGRNEIQLVISPEGRPTRHNLKVRIEIVVGSHEAIIWDKEFSVFLLWRVGDETGMLGGLSPSEVVGRIEQNEKSLLGRFVTVHPGEKLAKVISLTEGFRYYGLEDDSKGNDSGYERIVKFVIPDKVKTVSVRSTYLGWSYYSNHAVSSRMFGFLDSLDNSMDVYRGVLGSNRLVIHFED